MAKYIKTYEIHLGDYIRFRTISGEKLCGVVQCISEYPDIFVEVGDPKLDNYNRYRISVNLIDENYTDLWWKTDEVVFEKEEPIEFIYDKNLTDKIVTKLPN